MSNQSAALRLFLISFVAVAIVSSCAPSPTVEREDGDAATEPSNDEVGPMDGEGIEMQIYAEEDWYQARIEPEVLMRGVLKERESVVSPEGRQALLYQLVTEEGSLAVYAANAQARLDPFLDHRVEILGKLVDLEDEGFGEEIWIAFIEDLGSDGE